MGRTRFVAFDKKTGKVVWWASTGFAPKDTYYSTPVVANIGGQRLLISGGGDGGVHAFKVRTGERVWSYIFGTSAVNCSPVVDGNLVYVGHGEENEGINQQGRVICVDGSQVDAKKEPKLVWKVDGLKAKFASPVIHEGAAVHLRRGSASCSAWTPKRARSCGTTSTARTPRVHPSGPRGKFISPR